jgi:hypothetical protein
MQGLKDSIAVAVLPALTKLLAPLTEWIAKNRELIASRVGEYVRDVGNWLRAIDWKKVGAGALEFAAAFKTAMYGIRDVVEFIKNTITWFRNNWGWIRGALDVATFGAGSGMDAARQAIERQRAADAVVARHRVPELGAPAGAPPQAKSGADYNGGAVYGDLSALRKLAAKATAQSPSHRRRDPRFAGMARPIVALRPQPVKVAVSKGLLDVNINLAGAPPGTQARARPSAGAPLDRVNLGVAFDVF